MLIALAGCAGSQRPITEPAELQVLEQPSGGAADEERETPGVNHVVLPRQTLWRIAQAREDEAAIKTNERTLRTYLTRVEDYMPEAEEFSAFLGGGKNE